MISSHFRRNHRNASAGLLSTPGSAWAAPGGVSEGARRLRRLDGKPCSALMISASPRRSAIRIVAELKLLVESSSSLRNRGGTSFTDRNTRVRPPFAIKIVDVLTVTRLIFNAFFSPRAPFPMGSTL